MALNFDIAPAVLHTVAPPFVSPQLGLPKMADGRIPKAQAWASQYSSTTAASSFPILDLSQGVPKDAPHPSLLTSLSSTSSDPSSARYGSILGESSFREAFAQEICHVYDLKEGEVEAEDVGITAGCNMAFLVLLSVLCPPGSKVLMPLPAYFNAGMALSLKSVEPVYIPCDPAEAFRPDIAAARAALVKAGQEHGIRMIFLISPNNPTGTILSPEELEEWYDLAKEHRVALVLDETYRDFVEGIEGARGVPHRLWKRPDWRGTLISLGSFSSQYSASFSRSDRTARSCGADRQRDIGYRAIVWAVSSPPLSY